MKKFLAIATLLLAGLSYAKEPPPVLTGTASAPAASAPAALNEDALLEHKHYTNKKGHTVHSPAHSKSGKAPEGASAKCGDGTYSFSQSRRGTCSHHGGVVQWLN